MTSNGIQALISKIWEKRVFHSEVDSTSVAKDFPD